MKIGFIGFGNMAQAIATGLIENNVTDLTDLIFSNRTESKRKVLETQFNIKSTPHNQDVWNQSDLIILAVKPYQVEEVLTKIDKVHSPYVISVVAGVTNQQLAAYLPESSFIRTMPNLNAQVGEGITAIIENSTAKNELLEQAKKIFESIGTVVELPESQIGPFIAIAGSSPALVFMFIDTLARSAVKYGITKDKATEIAAQAVLGSAKTVLNSSQSPWNLIDQVSSPAGITVDGILSLLQNDFSASIIQSVDAMVEKNDQLSK
ncbi:pyrroline-5-carboxylate reductase [Marinilactibacillus sp. 15R]|uniref:pyrroline-5-carboxylate reductase n=1 Tax=Marinilactibacillus sp. 15R TaxID=1911586 RepID=UPI00090C1CB4|nr:pyrroline-5-carboxylate reductase [Marinilactibacillus sp. 15R]API87902.1 pyrroline-5-carboxylate reductase [Marinilactibacillus sp. 15R]